MEARKNNRLIKHYCYLCNRPSMDNVVDSKEGARLLLAYERVAELLKAAGENGVQREHLLMGIVLHCNTNEEALLQNVLKTRDELVTFYKDAEAAVEQYLVHDQTVPEPPSSRTNANEPIVTDKEEANKHTRAQPHTPTTPNNKATKRKTSSGSGSRRLSLRGFFTSGTKRRKSSLAMRGAALRNEQWTIENINQALINDDHLYEVKIPIRLLDGQVDRVNCSSRTTMADVLREIVNIHRINLTTPEDVLAIYECHNGLEPRLCKKDEFILGVVVRWEAKQDHIDDDDVTFILKRWKYEPNDPLDILAENANSTMDNALRVTYVDLTEHILKDDYKIQAKDLPRFAATKLFFENDGNKNKKFLKTIKKKIKDNFKKLVPDPGNKQNGRTKKEAKLLVQDIIKAYNKLIEKDDQLHIMKEFIYDYKKLCSNEYGSAFFNVKYSFSKTVTVISNGRLGINWKGTTLNGNDTDVAVVISYASINSITMETNKTIIIRYADNKILQIITDSKNAEMHQLLVQYQPNASNTSRKQNVNNGNSAISKIRRGSVADTMQRHTVKTTANSIMDDMADAFGDWDFALGDDEADDQILENNFGTDLGETTSEWNDDVRNTRTEGNDFQSSDISLEKSRTDNKTDNTSKESWEAHIDPNSSKVYYHNKDTGETKWELATSKDYNIQHDQTSGKNYFIHKKTKRTSWVIADSAKDQLTRASRALSNVYEE